MARRSDLEPLRRALRLAARGRYGASPNPRVGAVVVTAGGEVVGEGYHRHAGGPHAEIEALRQAGARARGAAMFVNLEPCSHFGRTPPCADAVVAAGIDRVVACHGDPDPRVSGEGFARLESGGVEVVVGPLVEAAVRLNLPFLVSVLERRPAITLKWAMSFDGRIATASGESQWISSPAGRRWALAQREEHDAILVGSGTVLADDPRLDRRLGKAVESNVRVVLDRRLRVRPEARLFDVEGEVLVYTENADASQRAALEARGAVVVMQQRATPATVVADLYGRGVRSLLVEGGSQVLAAFAGADLFDQVAVCCAPLLIGGDAAPGPLGGGGAQALAAAPRLEEVRLQRRGPDVVLTALRQGLLARLVASVERQRSVALSSGGAVEGD